MKMDWPGRVADHEFESLSMSINDDILNAMEMFSFDLGSHPARVLHRPEGVFGRGRDQRPSQHRHPDVRHSSGLRRGGHVHRLRRHPLRDHPLGQHQLRS